MSDFDIHNISFRNTGLFLPFLSDLFAALRVIYSRCPSHLFVVFLCLFKRPGDCCENLNEKGLSFPDTWWGVRKTKT